MAFAGVRKGMKIAELAPGGGYFTRLLTGAVGPNGHAFPEIAVVCLTASANLREVDALYEAGVVACLSKDQELDEIVEAIRKAS